MADMNQVPCRFGEEAFDVFAAPSIARQFEREFLDERKTREPVAVFRFHVGSDDVAPRFEIVHKGRSHEVPVPFSQRVSRISVAPGTPWQVDATLRRSWRMRAGTRLPERLQKFFTKRYITAEQQEYLHLVYGVVLWVIFLLGLSRGRIILHASGIAWSDRCVLLCGRGGVGKTSLSQCLVDLHDGRYVSDDLVMLHKTGKVVRNGLHIHVYPYNRLDEKLRRVDSIRKEGVTGRVHWLYRSTFLGPKRVCRRLSPDELYGERARENAVSRVSDIVWTVRDGSGRTELMQVGADEFARDHLEVLKKEMKGAFKFYELAGRCGWDTKEAGLPDDLESRVLDFLHELAQVVNLRKFNVAEGRTAEDNALRLVQLLGAGSAGDVPHSAVPDHPEPGLPGR